MHMVRFRLTGLLFVFGCQGAADEPPPGAAGAGSNAGGSASGTSAMGGSSSSNTAGHAGSTTPNGGMSAQGGGGGSSRAGTSGLGGAGAGTNGAGTSGVGTGSGGTTAGGGGSCVQNIGCKLAAPASTGDIYQDCVNRINQFLTQCACLPALARNSQGEACADQMAEYDAGKNEAHAGTTDKICEPRGSQNECPGYASNNQVMSLCFQQMWDEGPPPGGSCTGDCYEQHGHFINMTDKSVTKVACGFYTTASGKVWAVQNFFR
jgi:hypothetical protein